MRIGCVLLAAGSGRRFGGNKLAHCIDGVSMMERACALHARVDYAARVLVARPDDALAQSCAEAYAFTLAVNAQHARGIGTSAAVGMATLTAADAALDGALFCVCDQPYLTAGTIDALIRRFAEAPDCIVAPAFNGRRGNPVLFPRALFDSFLSLDGDIGGAAVMRAHAERVVLVPLNNARELTDIDTRRAIQTDGE